MEQSPQGKPLPEITDLTRPFWTAAYEGKLKMQKCGCCGTKNFYPKPWCVECGSRKLEWVEVKPTGTVYSFTTASLVMMNLPGWKTDLPVTLCLVDLDEGPRMYAQLTDCAPHNVRFGMQVEAHFEKIGENIGIPKFRPVGAKSGSATT
jgi:uncharacterized OB-fold protein